jgi:hypothetical protein
MDIKQEDINESDIHQGRTTQRVQYSLDAVHWYNEDDDGAKDIIDVPMTEKFRRYVYTDGSVSLPILRVETVEEQEG